MTDLVVVAPEPGSPEYDAAMILKAKEGGVTTTDHDAPIDETPPAGDKPVRPEHIPEKFWDVEKGEVNVEAMAKSYAEMEKLRGKSVEPAAVQTPEEKAAAEAAAKAVVPDNAGGDALRTKAEQEWLANDTLSEETFAAYEKVGVTREQIGSYIEGQKALATVRQQEAYGVAGGEEQYKAMQAWAAASMTQPEKEAYDRDVFAADKAVRANAISGLSARYAQANGHDGKMVVAGSGQPSTGDHFKSKTEMMTAMRDPQYKSSPAFRDEVARKMAASAAAGVYLGMN